MLLLQRGNVASEIARCVCFVCHGCACTALKKQLGATTNKKDTKALLCYSARFVLRSLLTAHLRRALPATRACCPT
eukprot:SAG31_NODE_27889_length_418_cov_1.730408_1_plen_75_part_01